MTLSGKWGRGSGPHCRRFDIMNDMTNLEITVRGSAERRYPAERAVVTLAAAIEGAAKDEVFSDAVAIQDPLTQQLRELADRNAVTTWSSGQIRVYSHRPWDGQGNRLPIVHVARLEVRAEFVDFERLSGFVDYWSGKDGVEVGGIAWDVSVRNRRGYEAEVRKAAVDDAVTKAQAYADAVRRGRVVAVHLADPDMLGARPPEPGPMFARASMDMGGAEPHLELTPEEIVIAVAVDAQFIAE